MAQLRKPDMSAVLERTNLTANFDGLMLPIYEAGSNSIQALLDKFGGDQITTQGILEFYFTIGTSAAEFSVTISDNAAGLDNNNYAAFLTPFTGHKLRKGGKGFGRFVAFKVFDEVEYVSKSSSSDGTVEARRFRFDIYADDELAEITGGVAPESESGCAVTYRQIKSAFARQWENLSDKRILDRLTSNFLNYLVDGRMPQTIVSVQDKKYDLRTHFATVFQFEKSHVFDLELRENKYEFRCNVSRVQKGNPFSQHTLLFFADDRLVGRGRAIENKLGKASFQKSDGTEYVVISSVSGAFLDNNANQSRTNIEADEAEIAQIVDEACKAILETESAQHELIKLNQKDQVIQLLSRHPLLRYALNGMTIEEYVKSKPNNWR